MKAIFIPTNVYPDLDSINKDLKDCKEIVKEIQIEHGSILIIDNVTRSEKLKELDKISKEE